MSPESGQLAGQHLDEGRLTRAVGADDAEAVAAHHPERQGVDDSALARISRRHAPPSPAHRRIPPRPPACSPSRPGGDARAGPCAGHGGCRGAARCACAGRSHRSAANAPRRQSCARACAGCAPPPRGRRRAKPRSRKSPARSAASRPGRARSSTVRGTKEAPVVADQDEGGADALQLGFEPLDRRQVEMVRRLIEEQHVGLRREGTGERDAAALAAESLVGSSSPVMPRLSRR